MADDPEISHWLNNLLKREGQEAVFSDDFEDVDDINEFDHFSPTEFSSVNDHFETPDNDDTLDEARRLLNRWAEQTESFQKPPSNSKNSRQASNERKTPKVVQYRKLEMPMIVAKKKNDIKVNDPTLKMNERLKKVQEMKEKRLAKQNERKISPTKVTKKNFQKIEVPDVDAEIRSIRQKMNENINMKKKEIELREKRMKEIEDNLFPSSENQNDPKRKQKDNLRINQNINRKNMNDRNQIIKADLRRNHIIETPNKSKYQLRHDSSNNCESFNQPKNQNISEKSNKPITKLNSNQSIRKSINKSRYSPKNDSHINAQQNENSIQTSENYEQEQRRINNGIEMKLKIFINNEEFRKKRFFFHHWSEKCHYQTQAFQKAAILANFRLLSKTFAFWKEAQKKIEQRKEIEILEKELRDRKRKETEVNFYFRKRKLRSYFSSWKTKYKASIELQIAQARKNKRLELIATKITNQNHSNTNNKNERNLNKNHIQSQNRNPASRNHLIRQNQHLNNHPNNSFNDFDGIVVNSNRLNSENNSQGSNYSRNSPYQAQNSSSTNSPSTNHSPPKKVKKIKFDPKIEEMEKRNEEKKKKRLERIQKQKEEEIEQKLKKEKEEADKIKQKRKEHLQQLENERKKREELKLQQIEKENQKKRKIYIAGESEKFRKIQLYRFGFLNWKKIIQIRNIFDRKAMVFYETRLKEKAVKAFIQNVNLNMNEREFIAKKFYNKQLLISTFREWSSLADQTKDKEKKLKQVHNMYLKKFAFGSLKKEKKVRKRTRLIQIQKTLENQMMKRVFKAWPEGCSAIREDEEREAERETLFSKALQYLDEISSDDF